jgi:microfibrillar-associated protein 1
MLKPVFVPKNKRATIVQREELELEEERIAEQEAQRLAERKEESKASHALHRI